MEKWSLQDLDVAERHKVIAAARKAGVAPEDLIRAGMFLHAIGGGDLTGDTLPALVAAMPDEHWDDAPGAPSP